MLKAPCKPRSSPRAWRCSWSSARWVCTWRFSILGGNDAFRPLLWLNPFLALLSGGGTATDAFARGAPAAYRTRPVAAAPELGARPAAARLGHRQPGVDGAGRRAGGRRGHRHRANSSIERRARAMTMLSPAATYHAELRQQLGSVGRALSVQRGLIWLARGLAAGTVVVLGLVIWAWIARHRRQPADRAARRPRRSSRRCWRPSASLFIRHNTARAGPPHRSRRAAAASARRPPSSWARAARSSRWRWRRCATRSST